MTNNNDGGSNAALTVLVVVLTLLLAFGALYIFRGGAEPQDANLNVDVSLPEGATGGNAGAEGGE